MKKRKWKCGICGHVQDIEITVCEYCGVDLLMSSNKKILVVEEPDPFDAETARKEAEEARKRAEAERQRKEEIRRKAEAERRKAEAERKREEEERRKAEAERKRAEELRRKEELERRRAEAERQKAEEERRKADAERKGKEQAEQLRREREEKRQAREAEKQRQKEEMQKQKAERKSRKKESKSGQEDKAPSAGRRIFKFLRNALLVTLALLVMLYIIGLSSREETDDVGNTVSSGVFAGNKVSGTCGHLVTWELDLDTGEMRISGTGEMFDFQPEGAVTDTMKNGDSAPPWIAYRDQIKRVFVEDQVREIGSWAFAYCEHLTEVRLGTGIKRLKASAFDHSPVADINLPEGLRVIGDNALSGTMLSEIVLPASLEYLGRGAFEHCPKLRTVKVLGEKTRLNFDTWNGMLFSDANGDVFDLVLWGYTNSMVEEYARIKGIQFRSLGDGNWEATGGCGENLEWYLDLNTGFLKITGTGAMQDYIGSWMLEDENWVRENSDWLSEWDVPPWDAYLGKIYAVSIGDGVTHIGENAFAMSNLVDVHFGSSVESVGGMAFLETALDQIVFPDTVQSIGHNCFNWCKNLTYAELPIGLERLEETVFNQCRNLESLYVGRYTQMVDEGYTPFTQPDETYMPDNLTIYGLQNSDAERFAREHNIPFTIGYRGMAADAEGQMGDDAWWFKSGDILVLYGTGETWIYHASLEDPPTGEEEKYKQLFAEGKAFSAPPDFFQFKEEIYRLVVVPGLEMLNHNLLMNMNLRHVDLGTVKRLGLAVLSGNPIERIEVPETVELVRGFSFSECEELSRVTILGDCGVEFCVFHNTPRLREVYFGPNVELYDDENGDLFKQWNTDVYDPGDDLVFYVTPGSDAERYATEHGIPFAYWEA